MSLDLLGAGDGKKKRKAKPSKAAPSPAPAAPVPAAPAAPAEAKPDPALVANAADRAKDVAAKADAATTPAEALAVKTEAAPVAAQVAAQAPTPELKEEAARAQRALAVAQSPDEVRAATEQVVRVADESKRSSEGVMAMLRKKYGPLEAWQYGVIALLGGVGVVVLTRK